MVNNNKKKKKRKKYNYGRKYLEELKVSYYETPQGYCMEHNDKKNRDKRRKKWHEERQIYGFDERETWCLYNTIDEHLYERLKFYKEVTQDTINLEYYKIEFKSKKYTLLELIDKMIEGLELEIKIDEYDESRNDPEIKEKIDDIYLIFRKIKYYLWW